MLEALLPALATGLLHLVGRTELLLALPPFLAPLSSDASILGRKEGGREGGRECRSSGSSSLLAYAGRKNG